MPKCCIIIPCYNEGKRLNSLEFVNFVAQHPKHAILFVNDGSTDNTAEVISNLIAQNPKQLLFLNNLKNSGKAETVRLGLLHAESLNNFNYLAFLDADLATPIEEITSMIDLLEEKTQFDLVYGSRIKRLGANIQRSETRHYLGRIFVTYTNLFLEVGAYDSQCGAKLFKAKAIKPIFDKPFVSSWFFDIEIILRYQREKIIEFPISNWFEMGGSKLKLSDFAMAPFEILKIRKHYKQN